MADEFTRSQDQARKELLQTIGDTDREIAGIYSRASKDMTALANSQRHGSLTERWQRDMAASLSERVQQLNGDVLTAVIGASGQAAQLPGGAHADWLGRVLQRATGSQNGGDAFRSVMTRTSDEALRAVVTGQAYLDGKRLSSRIWSHGGRLQGGIDEILRQGIAQKKSAYQLAKELEAYVNPGAREDMDWRKVYPDLPAWLSDRWTSVEKNSQRLARTSINHAYHIAMKEAAAANYFAKAIHWALSPNHYERQILPFGADVCDDYAAHDEGLGAGNWPIDKVPLPHAMCLCSQYAVSSKDLEGCARELKDWLDGGSNPGLDDAFGAWKSALQADGSTATISPMDHTAADQRVRQMEAIIGQDWAQGLTIPDREAVMQVFENATDEELRFWQRHGDLVRGDFYNRTVGAHYQPTTKRITMDISKPRGEDKRLKQSKATTTFFHETGHLFDWQAFDGTRLQDALGDFDATLESDYLARANKLLDAAGEKPITSLARLSVTQKHVLTQDLYTDRDLKSNISDIVGGLTNNRLTNGWGHSADYWKRMSPKVEAVAEMFEAQMMKGERLEVMREYFPTAYDQFVQTIKKLEGGGT
jgi:hypothetical protein